MLGPWPRSRFELVPDAVHVEGLEAFEIVGVDVQDVIERRTATTVSIQVLRGRFVRKRQVGNPHAETFAAERLDLPIPREVAGPGLLAETIVRRWRDHESLKAQSAMFAKERLTLEPSTLGGWHDQLAALAQPVVASMWAQALSEPYLFVDAGGALVTDKEKCRTGHFWIVVAPDQHVLFGFSERGGSPFGAGKELNGYQGYCVLDAHALYQHVCEAHCAGQRTCWDEARHTWFRVIESDPQRAKVAIEHIDSLFNIERTISNETRKKKEAVRRSDSRPMADRFLAWCESQSG
jgi:transposase